MFNFQINGIVYVNVILQILNKMASSVLEITDQEYLIKLNKTDFDLTFIHTLLKRIQTEKTFFSRIWDSEEDIISKGNYADELDIDHLSEK